jgi:hypothetical protein
MQKKFLTKAERLQFSLTPKLKGILVGLLLGDLNAQKYGRAANARFRFEQGTVHKDYLNYLYELFKTYCPSEPQIITRSPDKRTGKEYTKIKFNTYSLPCFNELFDLFYPEGKKVVPKNIADLLTLEGLCHWICDDGYWHGNGVLLCTNAFTKEEVDLLVKALYDNYNFKCTICLGGSSSGNVIRISSKSVPHLQTLLFPIMPPMMRHKIFGKS